MTLSCSSLTSSKDSPGLKADSHKVHLTLATICHSRTHQKQAALIWWLFNAGDLLLRRPRSPPWRTLRWRWWTRFDDNVQQGLARGSTRTMGLRNFCSVSHFCNLLPNSKIVVRGFGLVRELSLTHVVRGSITVRMVSSLIWFYHKGNICSFVCIKAAES